MYRFLRSTRRSDYLAKDRLLLGATPTPPSGDNLIRICYTDLAHANTYRLANLFPSPPTPAGLLSKVSQLRTRLIGTCFESRRLHSKFIMSYPPPPGASNSSLPPRPPPAKSSGFKPAFSSVPAHTPSPSATASPYAPPSYSSAPSYSNAPSYPGASAPPYGASYPAYPQPAAAAAVSGAGYGPQASRPYQSYQDRKSVV